MLLVNGLIIFIPSKLILLDFDNLYIVSSFPTNIMFAKSFSFTIFAAFNVLKSFVSTKHIVFLFTIHYLN